MKITVESYEGIDFPFMLPSKRKEYEQKLKKEIRSRLELKHKNTIELHQFYRNYKDDKIIDDNKYMEVVV